MRLQGLQLIIAKKSKVAPQALNPRGGTLAHLVRVHGRSRLLQGHIICALISTTQLVVGMVCVAAVVPAYTRTGGMDVVLSVTFSVASQVTYRQNCRGADYACRK